MGQIIFYTLQVNIKALENTILEITFKLCWFNLQCSRNAIPVKITPEKSALLKILPLFPDVVGQIKLKD